jgi:dephospho-CoA kinase
LIKIGLTGGIGSGKSTVAEFFSGLGAFWIDYDQLSRRVEAENLELSDQIAENLGIEPGLSDQQISEIVFSSPTKLKVLEAIKHPKILELAQRIQTENQVDFAVFLHEVPLLTEINLSQEFDLVIVVTARTEARIERVQKLRGWSREQIIRRMETQADDSERLKIADYVIENNSDLAELKLRVGEIWREINSN